MPWNTTVAVAWTDTVTAPDGREFRNDGMHLATMRWGRLTSIRYYWDTELVAAACAHVAALGVEEAAEAPLACTVRDHCASARRARGHSPASGRFAPAGNGPSAEQTALKVARRDAVRHGRGSF